MVSSDMGPSWEHFQHGADIGVRGTATTKAQAFEQAAIAMTAIVTDPLTVATVQSVQIECDASSDDLLLAEWLNALIYEMSTRKMLFSRFSVRLDGAHLSAMAWGEPIDRSRHRPAVELKGATYTSLRVAQENGRWIAQTVVDV